MTRRRHYGRGRGQNSSIPIGVRMAMKHIDEANAFKEEVGGADNDVKDYFFRLSHHDRSRIFRLYGQLYGEGKRAYAESTFHQWKTGQTRMSGLVAKRLFDLLPRHMPAEERFGLVDTLWRKFRPSTTGWLTFGPTSTPAEIEHAARKFLDDASPASRIPDNFRKRFSWLSGGDVTVYEQLQEHYVALSRLRAAQAIAATVAVVREHLDSQSSSTIVQQFSRSVEVDGVTLTATLSQAATEARVSTIRPQTALPAVSGNRFSEALGWVMILLLLYCLSQSC